MKRILAFVSLLIAGAASAQNVNWKKIREADPDRILQADRKPTEVLLLGTFHFGYPNLDAHKTDSSKFIDVMSPSRQKEIQELADVIAKFKPTRVYIEAWNSKFHDSLYAEYRAGRYKLGRNEIYQVAYRAAAQAGLSRLYTVDAGNFAGENYKSYPKIDSMWEYPKPVDSLNDKYWRSQYSKFYNAADSIETTLTMLENFILMAEPSVLRRMHGAYVTGGFNTIDNAGPDIIALWWFSRNLRTFNNILKTRPGSNDRILVLFGNGHAPILKQCFESSPEFKVVELKSLL